MMEDKIKEIFKHIRSNHINPHIEDHLIELETELANRSEIKNPQWCLNGEQCPHAVKTSEAECGNWLGVGCKHYFNGKKVAQPEDSKMIEKTRHLLLKESLLISDVFKMAENKENNDSMVVLRWIKEKITKATKEGE